MSWDGLGKVARVYRNNPKVVGNLKFQCGQGGTRWQKVAQNMKILTKRDRASICPPIDSSGRARPLNE